jgi:hypothetical protein
MTDEGTADADGVSSATLGHEKETNVCIAKGVQIY